MKENEGEQVKKSGQNGQLVVKMTLLCRENAASASAHSISFHLCVKGMQSLCKACGSRCVCWIDFQLPFRKPRLGFEFVPRVVSSQDWSSFL